MDVIFLKPPNSIKLNGHISFTSNTNFALYIFDIIHAGSIEKGLPLSETIITSGFF